MLLLIITINMVLSANKQNVWYISESYNKYPDYTYHNICHVFYDTTDTGASEFVNDNDDHEIRFTRDANGDTDVANMTPRFGDIRRLRYRHFLLNTNASHVGGDHYVVWDISKTCSTIGARPTVCYKIRFFPCLENAERFYDTLRNTNKARYDPQLGMFDEFDRQLASSSSFSHRNDLPGAFTGQLAVCAA